MDCEEVPTNGIDLIKSFELFNDIWAEDEDGVWHCIVRAICMNGNPRLGYVGYYWNSRKQLECFDIQHWQIDKPKGHQKALF